MGFELSPRDRARLNGVHPDLVRVVDRAAETSDVEFTVLEGVRTTERQKQLVAKGASQTMNSRHIKAANGFGHAVDLAPLINGQVSWDWPLYHKLCPIVKDAAEQEGVAIEWGGDWKQFKDGPHWQLPWSKYPGKSMGYGLLDAEPRYQDEPIPDDFPYQVGTPRTATKSKINWSLGGIGTAAAGAGAAIWNNTGSVALICLTVILVLCIIIFREELKAIARERLG
ncbi:M15 family metallopeptidase [Pseudorhodoplanes sinuspersici]|uniref:Peptidase M15C domain-containing protein n=1 Tax=Pseudorhodoplanes sinuspersici TaxID=1235591 RepID=A0A1W6ZYR0_9HYPH|nr:M15 family metallopeptidase [Pseudorhodoplanes sinuspersici]ARQ01875.1 hypothetical protein CAK95_24345 [Pseudorhodoplanes sinuspersici]RKE73640.1 D-alanyl-D-alanine carboxypeptidase-like protein [Pseudorhodoplanes sinuspersici]